MKILPLSTYQSQRKTEKYGARHLDMSPYKSFTGRKLIPPTQFPKIMPMFNNQNIDLLTRVKSSAHKEAYSMLQKFRKGDMQTKKMFENMIFNAKKLGTPDAVYNYDALNYLHRAFYYELFAFPGQCNIEYSPFVYHRIFRTIGENEYNKVIGGHHIVAPSCNDESVMVTNNPRGVSACTSSDGSTKSYFVQFKDKINFDPLAARYFYSLENIQHTEPFNVTSAEYNLVGGYNIEDIEKILDLRTKEVVFSND